MEQNEFEGKRDAILALDDDTLRDAVQRLATLGGIDGRKAQAIGRDVGKLRRKLAQISERDIETLLSKLPQDDLAALGEQLKQR